MLALESRDNDTKKKKLSLNEAIMEYEANQITIFGIMQIFPSQA